MKPCMTDDQWSLPLIHHYPKSANIPRHPSLYLLSIHNDCLGTNCFVVYKATVVKNIIQEVGNNWKYAGPLQVALVVFVAIVNSDWGKPERAPH